MQVKWPVGTFHSFFHGVNADKVALLIALNYLTLLLFTLHYVFWANFVFCDCVCCAVLRVQQARCKNAALKNESHRAL